MVFDKLVWKQDRVLLDDLVFRLELEKQEGKSAGWELGDNCFDLYKVKWILDDYARFLESRPRFRAQHILEIGIWDGASLALWFEHFQPRKLVGLDIGLRKRGDSYYTRLHDSDYFKRYLATRGIQDRLKTYWGVDQADRVKVLDILAQEFDGPLDLVIDDGSHQYEHSKAAFHTLFPLLRPGGLYILEDWSWSHWKGYEGPDHPWANEPPLTRLVNELIEVNGSPERFLAGAGSMAVLHTLVATITIYPDFAVIERGDVPAGELKDFSLHQYVVRRPQDDPYRLNAAYQTLQRGHEELQARFREVETNYQCMEEWKNKLEANQAEVLKYHRELEACYRQLDKDYQGLAVNTEKLQTAYDELETNHRQMLASCTDLTASAQEWRQHHDTLANAYDELLKSRDDLLAGTQEWEKCYRHLDQAYQELLKSRDELLVGNEEWAKCYADLNQSQQELRRSHDELAAGNQEWEKRCGALVACKQEWEQSYGDLEKTYQGLQKSHDDVTAENQEWAKSYADLEQAHQELARNYNGLIAKHQRLHEDHDTLEQRWQTLEGNHDDLRTRHEEPQTRYSQLEGGHQVLEVRHRKLRSKYEGLQLNPSTLQVSHRELQTTHRQLGASHEEPRTSYQELQDYLASLLAEHQELGTNHQKLREAQRELEAAYYNLEQRQVPLTYFSGLVRETLRVGWRKLKRSLWWSRS